MKWSMYNFLNLRQLIKTRKLNRAEKGMKDHDLGCSLHFSVYENKTSHCHGSLIGQGQGHLS